MVGCKAEEYLQGHAQQIVAVRTCTADGAVGTAVGTCTADGRGASPGGLQGVRPRIKLFSCQPSTSMLIYKACPDAYVSNTPVPSTT